MDPSVRPEFSEWLTTFATIVGVIYLGGPVLIYFTLRQSADPKLVRVDLNRDPLPSAIRDYFAKVEKDLATCGFEPVDDIVLPNQVRNVAANLRLFVNRQTQDTASCTAIFLKRTSGWQTRLKYVSFTTFFRDGIVYGTSNSTEIGCFPPRPNYLANRLPKLRRPAELYKIHCGIVRKASRADGRILPIIDQFNGDGVAYMQWSMTRELEEAARAGALYLNEATRKYCPTPIGALVMTWKLPWPWKLIRKIQCNANAARILAEQSAA